MLARRLTTILPAMTLAEVNETARSHRITSLKDDRTALIKTRPCRAPYHTIWDVGLLGGGTCQCRARYGGPIMACAAWIRSPSVAAMCSRACVRRLRTGSQEYLLPRVLDMTAFTALVASLVAPTGSRALLGYVANFQRGSHEVG